MILSWYTYVFYTIARMYALGFQTLVRDKFFISCLIDFQCLFT